MKPRAALLLATPLAVLMVALGLLHLFAEPRHQGKTLTAWLVLLEQNQTELDRLQNRWIQRMNPGAVSESPEERQRKIKDGRELVKLATEAILQIGTNGLPHLRRMIEARDSTLKTKLMEWPRKQTWMKIKFRSDREWQGMGVRGFKLFHDEAAPFLLRTLEGSNFNGRRVAAELLGELRTRARRVVPVLMTALRDRDEDVRATAARSLGRYRHQAAPAQSALLEALADRASRVRQMAAWALQQIGEDAQAARPKLLSLLNDADPRVQEAALDALVAVGVQGSAGVETILRIFRGGQTGLKERAIHVLGAMGPSAQSVVPDLIGILPDDSGDENLQEAAIEALPKIVKNTPSAEELVPLLAKLTDREGLHHSAMQALRHLGKPAVPLLIQALDSDKEHFRQNALEARIDMGREAFAAAPAVIRLLNDPSSGIANTAARFILEMGLSGAPHLMAALDAQNPPLWRNAAGLLGQIQYRDDVLIEKLISALKNPELAQAAAGTLARLRAKTELAVPALVEAVGTLSQFETKRAIVDAIGRYKGAAGAALPVLKQLARNDPTELRFYAAGAIARIDPRAEECVPALAEALRHERPALRVFAASMIKDTSIDGKFAVPALIEMLRDADLTARNVAAGALGKTGPEAGAAAPALIAALSDESWRGYKGATEYPLASVGKPAVPHLIKALEDPAKTKSILRVFNYIGPDAAEAAPAILEKLRKDCGEIREWAAQALGSIGPKAAPVAAKLSQMIQQPDGDLRLYAAFALARVEPENVEAREAVMRALDDEREGIRVLAALTLSRIQPPPKEAIPRLLATLHGKFEESGVKRAILEALGKFARSWPEVVPVLSVATRDRDEWAALAAVRALREAGPRAREAVPALLELLQAGSHWRHGPRDVIEALERIDPASVPR